MTKRQKAIDQDDIIRKTPQPLKFVLIVLRYYTKEFLTILVAILLGLFILFNVSWNKSDGLQIKPSIKVEVTK